MPSLGRHASGFQSGWSAAYDNNLASHVRFRQLAPLSFAADDWIVNTPCLPPPRDNSIDAARVGAHARPNVVELACGGFVRDIWIGQRRTNHRHHVATAFGNQLIRVARIDDTAQCGDGSRGDLADALGQPNMQSVRCRSRGPMIDAGKSLEIVTTGNQLPIGAN